MSKTVLYIAMSLDGYIAKPDGSLDWLTSTPTPKDGGDYGYSDLIARVGSTVMGRTTYEEILGFGGEWPYSGLDSFVVTSNSDLEVKSPDTKSIDQDIASFLSELKATAKKDIWIVG